MADAGARLAARAGRDRAGRAAADARVGLVGAVGVLLLAALPAAAVLAAAVWALRQPMGLDYAEPVVYGQALRLVHGEPLYQALGREPYTVAAYTPLYYWLGAALHTVFGPGFAPGRAASLAAGILSAVLVGILAAGPPADRGRSPRWAVGALGALVFTGFAFAGEVPWLGLYRVDVFGVALALASVTLLRRSRGGAHLIGAGVLAGLALLTKQSLFAALLGGAVWLWPDRRQVIAFVAPAIAVVAMPCAILNITTANAFAENALAANLNPLVPSTGLDLARIYVATQWLPLLLAGGYVMRCRAWQATESRLLVLYWAATSLSLLGLAKIGANTNYWIEPGAATAVLAARGAGLAMPRAAGVIALALAFGIVLGGPAGALQTARGLRAHLAAATAPGGDGASDSDFENLLQKVRDARGDVLAEPMDVLVLADRPVLLEPFVYNLRLAAGVWQPDDLVRRIACGEVGLLVLAYPLETGADLTDGSYALWPPPVMAALQAGMTLNAVTTGRYLYTPRHDPDVYPYQPDPPGCAAHT